MVASCLDESRALAFLAGELAPAQRDDVEAHVDDCVACRKILAELVRGDARRPTEPGGSWREGDTVGRYVVKGALGRGGMGVVYRAEDVELGRPVALKRLHAASATDPEARARLVREARAAAQLAHPNVVTVYEVGEEGGAPFLAMELVDGITLSAWLAATPRTWREIVAVLVQAGRGLAAAHERGLVHRDFKPDNVLIDRSGRARVADFGLARTWDGERGGKAMDAGLARLTATGVVSGTPAYLAPELVDGAAPSAASDQYAFAVTLHEALRGQHPFAGGTPTAIWAEMAAGRIRDGGRPVPAWLDRVVRRGLAVQPAARWPGVGALCEALERPPRRMWPWLAAAGGIAVASLAVAIVALVSARQPAAPAIGRSGMSPVLEQMMSDATNRAVDDHHVASFVGAEIAMAADPNNGWAHQMVVTEACVLHFPAIAREAFLGMPAAMHDTMERSCRSYGVDPDAGILLASHDEEQAAERPAPAVEPPAPQPAPSRSRNRALDQAADEYLADPAAALSRLRPLLASAPGDQDALRLAVLAACNLNYEQKLGHRTGDRAESEAAARGYFAKLTPANRWAVWSECDRWAGIWLEGDVERGGKIVHIGPRPPRPHAR